MEQNKTIEEVQVPQQTKEELEKTHYGAVQEEDWLLTELEKLELEAKEFEELPAFKPEEDKEEIIVVDIKKPWDKWIDKDSGIVKKKIPVQHAGERKLFWLNTRNPVYKDLLQQAYEAQKQGQTAFTAKLFRIGKQQNTRYKLIK